MKCIAIVYICMSAITYAADKPHFEETVVWKKNEERLWPYQCPGVMVTKRGTVLVWADGRYDDPGDFGPHHLALKRSTDGGQTFGPNQYIGNSTNREIYLFGNAIEPRGSGRIHFIYTQKDPENIHRNTFIWHRVSEDQGETWSKPERIEQPLVEADQALRRAIDTGSAGSQFDGEDATLYARRQFYTGPGLVIQLREDNPSAPVRIVIPLLVIGDRNHRDIVRRGMGNAVLISDDQGRTWKAGGIVPIAGFKASEPSISELADGTLVINARIARDTRRSVSYSRDGGKTWTRPRLDDSGIPPFSETHAGLLRFTDPHNGADGKGHILFSFPNARVRQNMTVLMSSDEHQSWSMRCLVHKGPSYYSNMAFHDGTVYLIYGRGGEHRAFPAETALARFNLTWLRANAVEGKPSSGQ